MKKKKLLAVLSLAFVCCAAVGVTTTSCDFFGGAGILQGAKLEIDKTTLELNVNGKNGTVRASMNPADKSAIYEWSVEDDTVASIKSKQSVCTVTPLKEGTTKVTVKAGEQTAVCTVNVGPDLHVKLNAPSFTYDAETGIVNITDENDAATVGGYTMYFFNADGEEAGSVEVKDGEAVDTRRIDKGAYTVKLTAFGADELYLESDFSESSAELEVKYDALYDLSTGDAGAQESKDGWAYYKYNWVVVHEAYHYNNAATVQFSNNTADALNHEWILQLIYNLPEAEVGKTYQAKLSFHSTAEGRITLDKKAVTVYEGDNIITVAFTVTNDNKGLFKIKFGVGGELNTLKEGTATVSLVEPFTEITETKILAVPDSFSYNSVDKTVSIVDSVNNQYDVKYMLGFFENETSSTVLGTAVVADGEVLNVENVLSGTYFARIMSATTGLPYESSTWSTYGQEITVVNEKVDIKNGGQSVAFDSPNTWYEWHSTADQQMANVTVKEAYIDLDNKVHVQFEVPDGAETEQPLKLFYRDSAIAVGDVYKLTMKVDSPMAGYIKVNGTAFQVQEGVNDISVIRMQPNKNAADRNTITVQFGATVEGVVYTMKGAFVISDYKTEIVDPIALEKPTVVYDTVTNTATVRDYANPQAGVKEYQIGLFKEGAETPVATFAVVEGVAFDFASVVNGTYSIKVKAVAQSNTMYVDSAWNDSEYTVTVKNRYTEFLSGGQAVAYGDPGAWYYYKPGGTTITQAVYDNEENKVDIEYTTTVTTNEPLKIFFRAPDIAVEEEYTLSFTFQSPMAGYITVNGVDFAVQEGNNSIVTTRKQPSNTGNNYNTITVRFGATVDGTVYTMYGKFAISDIFCGVLELENLTAPAFTFDAATLTVAIPAQESDADKVASYELGLFEEGATTPTATFTVANGTKIDVSQVVNGTYTVKVRALTADAMFRDSAWTDSATTIEIGNTTTDITKTGQANAYSNPGEWYHYKEKITLEYLYVDNTTGSIHAKYEATSAGVTTPTYQPLKLFWNSPDLAVGDEYTLSFNFNSSMAGYIMVCGTQFEVQEGDNAISVTRAQMAKSGSDYNTITVQFGAKVNGVSQMLTGEFVISDIDVVKA